MSYIDPLINSNPTLMRPWIDGVGVHPHVALSATRGKASPSLKEFFQPCFLAALEESFQPCLLAAFKEQMFL